MDWNGCGNYRRECVAHWTKLFATNEVVHPDNDNERRFVALVTANRFKLQKCDARSKDFQLFVLPSE